MAQIEIVMPKMGESIMEATIIKWSKQVGETVEMDETLLEIATDKVDSEVPSPVRGTVAKLLFEADAVVQIGTTIALIATEGEELMPSPALQTADTKQEASKLSVSKNKPTPQKEVLVAEKKIKPNTSKRFYSPLVKNIAQKENIAIEELEKVVGTGKSGRVTKKDMLNYVAKRKNGTTAVTSITNAVAVNNITSNTTRTTAATSINGAVEIVEMSRTRRLIAEHMVHSKQTSAHVTSFIEIDVTNLVNWRNKVKESFKAKHKQNITFTPIFMEAVVKAIQDFPLINASVDGNNILVKKGISLGMATALPSGNLIVPVIKNADQLNLVGMAKTINDLANRARNNALKPDEVKDGTYTVTNVGSFGSVFGTPIINQPQVAILALGAIRKVPSVIETAEGDFIGVRSKMFLSHSYDHRVVNGALGGMFIKTVADYLEAWDVNRAI